MKKITVAETIKELRERNRNPNKKDVEEVFKLIAEKRAIIEEMEARIDEVQEKIQATNLYVFNGGIYTEMLCIIHDVELKLT